MWNRQDLSRYVRTTWMLNAQCNLELPPLKARVRFLSAQETASLSETARRHNVFARQLTGNNFYVQRIGELSNTTVIEVLRPGDPDDMIPEAQAVAGLLERLAVLSSTFVLSRPDLHRLLAITPDRSSSVDFTFGRQFYYLRSTARPTPIAKGIAIDDRFTRRFERCGFPQLVAVCPSGKEIARRLDIASHWLFESRREPSMPAAIVKTAIALEALLIANESEPLTRALSERAAFLLSRDAVMRRALSRNVRKFYTARSAVVHGSRRRTSDLSPELLEGMDRLILLLCLMMAANIAIWPSMEALTAWCEDQKWGAPAVAVIQPFPGQYLTGALRLFDQARG
jgi:Apea-like HEPN